MALSLDGRTYLLHSKRLAGCFPPDLIALLQESEQDLVPLSIVRWSTATFDQDDLTSTCSRYSQIDDVWCSSFATVWLVLRPTGFGCSVQVKDVFTINRDDVNLTDGPYVFARATHSVHQVSLLRADPALAFINGVVDDTASPNAFHTVSTSLGIPVPSKLYHVHDQQPLAGLRFAVKDSIAIRGLRNGFGSEAWRDTYPPETATAPCIQVLLNAGAVLVGVVKSTEFAEGVDPCEWIDSICPYNPRGDGQQKASSSSAGSAVAAAAYDWLDFTVGTDTGGSIRHPAGVQGLYGQRPSSALARLDGVLGATDLFNTVGVFARDVETFCRAGSYIANLKQRTLPLPKRKFNLLYPTRAAQITNPDQHHHGQHRWFPNPDVCRSTWTEAEKQIDITITHLESALDCERIPFNINELWRIIPPLGQSKSLDEATGHIYSTITTSSAVHTCIDKFILDYAATHDGAHPRISELVQRRLKHGRRISKKKFAKALKSMQAFANWTDTTLFGSYDQEAMTLLVFPQNCGRPDYRDDIPDRTELFNDTFSIYSFGHLVGCPDYTIPVGEKSFTSKVTGKTEYLPVSMSLISRPGTDAELFGVMRQLKDAGVFRDVLTGPRLYDEHCDGLQLPLTHPREKEAYERCESDFVPLQASNEEV